MTVTNHVEKLMLKLIEKNVSKGTITDEGAACLLFRVHCRFHGRRFVEGGSRQLSELMSEINTYQTWVQLRKGL